MGMPGMGMPGMGMPGFGPGAGDPMGGMTKMPMGMPLMAVAWTDCMVWAAGHEPTVAQYESDTGKTLYFLVADSAGQYWDGGQFSTFVAASWSSYVQTLTETGSGTYRYYSTR
jgi:hypothetical protein